MINQNAKLKEICSLLLEEVIWETMKEVKIHEAKIEKLELQKFMHQKQIEELKIENKALKVKMKMKN